MFDIHFYGTFYGTSYSDKVAYTWYWSNEKNAMQSGVTVNGWMIRVDL